MLAWESFGSGWVTDVVKQLKLDARVLEAPYGDIVDFAKVDFDRDVVFTWNGTTSGVRVPNGDAIPAGPPGPHHLRRHLGGLRPGPALRQARRRHLLLAEGAGRRGRPWHADPVPRAVERLETYKPAWPLPKIFRLTSGGKLIEGIFKGDTINTPSMICVEDYIDALKWADGIGGLEALIARANANTKAIADWVARTPSVAFLAKTEAIRSNTSVCLSFVHPTSPRSTSRASRPSSRR
jgi:phosphoserine aminotransferase apoenzyme (EC 2.6.1.52)